MGADVRSGVFFIMGARLGPGQARSDFSVSAAIALSWNDNRARQMTDSRIDVLVFVGVTNRRRI